MASLTVNFTPTTPPAGTTVRIWASGPVSKGVRVPKELYLMAVFTSAGVFPISPRSILAAWTARFGALKPGQRIFVGADSINPKGFKSAMKINSTVVT